jgi:hypothetical protein
METINQMQSLPAPKDLELTATLPAEMISAQHNLIQWCEQKIQFIQKETEELKQATAHAKKMKWKYTTLQNQFYRSEKRLSFYEKIKAALVEGYYIIPNFDVDVFAVRTEKDKPKKYLTHNRWSDRNQSSADVKLGCGDYKNDRPLVSSRYIDEKTTQFWASKWDEQIEFPINMCKPVIMEATSRAMALKIFDEIGVFPSARKDDDPVIIGRINTKVGYFTKRVSFMIVWHLNTNVL